jgi:hypothetical protein
MLIPFEKLIRKYNIHPKGVLHVGASTGQEAKDYFLTTELSMLFG